MNFIWIFFAHFIGDIALQSDWQAQNKGKLWYVMFSHCMIWTACICIGLEFIGLFAIWKVPFLCLGHWICDYWKSQKPKTPEAWKFIYPDQVFHFVQLFIVWLV